MNESLMKTDMISRLHYTPVQEKTMVDAYRASGLSAPRFATHHGVTGGGPRIATKVIDPVAGIVEKKASPDRLDFSIRGGASYHGPWESRGKRCVL